jgi:hypothetical protein
MKARLVSGADKRPMKARVVSATGHAGGAGNGNLWTAREIEDVLSKATAEAQDKGITDPDELRDYKLKARADFKDERRKAAQPKGIVDG